MVTVIITTCLRPPELVVRSITSVVNQTYKDLEIIVVDDSPQSYEYRMDVYNSIVGIKDTRIKYLFNSENIGACASRNRAIKCSLGDYIIYVDDDDELVKDCIEKRLEKMNESNAGLIYSDSYIVDEETKKMHMSNQPKYRGMVFDELIKSNFIEAFPLIKRECFLECGLFDVEMQAAQDYEMWLRIALKFSVDYVNEPLAIIHLHKGERISKNPQKKIQGLERISNIYKEYLDRNPSAKYIRTMKMIPYYTAIGNKKKARELYLQAVKIYPFRILTNAKYLKQLIRYSF